MAEPWTPRALDGLEFWAEREGGSYRDMLTGKLTDLPEMFNPPEALVVARGKLDGFTKRRLRKYLSRLPKPGGGHF